MDKATKRPAPLIPEHRARILSAISGPAPDWPMPPLLPGAWTMAEPAQAYDLLEMSGRYALTGALGQPVPVAYELCRVRYRPLLCYGDAILVEALAQVPREGLVSFILHRDGVTHLDGGSDAIHALNLSLPVDLSTEEARTDYVQLFMNWVRSSRGRFQPLEEPLALTHRMDEATLDRISPHAAAWSISLCEQESNTWQITGSMLYGGQVFSVRLILRADGFVMMTDDVLVLDGIPLRREYMTRFLLWLGEETETDPTEDSL